MVIAHIIFPVGLYSPNPYLNKEKEVFVVEDYYYFQEHRFHKMKLVLHRASMMHYYHVTLKNHIKKHYISFSEGSPEEFLQTYTQIKTIEFINPNDHRVVALWTKSCKKHLKQLMIYPWLNFLLTPEDIHNYQGSYYHDRSFYPMIRKKYNVLMTKDGKPEGGKYSFDKENRKPWKTTTTSHDPVLTSAAVMSSKYVKEAKEYVNKHFSDNPGDMTEFFYPIHRKEALLWLEKFIEERLTHFGPFQDAFIMDPNERYSPYLYHSCIASSLNIGILRDKEVLDRLLLVSRKKVSLSSLEGFVRQLLGWRNYVLLIYEREGARIRKMNFFHHRGTLSDRWWYGQTGMPHVDHVIQKVWKYSYAHHIERLMILGVWMLLCEINPIEVNNWFHAFVSIDAYDVFMIPNVMGMSQHADGGITMTRPYICSSSYLCRMGPNYNDITIKLDHAVYHWTDVWDAMYYHFIQKNKTYLSKNYATAPQVKHWNKKTNVEKQQIQEIAKKYKKHITTSIQVS